MVVDDRHQVDAAGAQQELQPAVAEHSLIRKVQVIEQGSRIEQARRGVDVDLIAGEHDELEGFVVLGAFCQTEQRFFGRADIVYF